MSPTEVLPLLVVVVLMLSIGGAEPDSMEVVFDGDRAVTSVDEVLVVGGGNVTLPASANATGDLHVIGGNVTIAGTLDGDVQLLAGNLSLTDGATVTGELRTIGGDPSVAEGASVGRLTRLQVTEQPRSPLTSLAVLGLQTLTLAAVAAWLARRAPWLLDNVGDSVTDHVVVSGVVGAIAGATLLVLFVYMAFTLILLPLSVAGLVGLFGLLVYSYVVFGHLVGRRLPIDRTAPASGVGAAGIFLGIQVLDYVPLVGVLAQFLLAAVGIGAILISYFGLQSFEPAEIPG